MKKLLLTILSLSAVGSTIAVSSCSDTEQKPAASANSSNTDGKTTGSQVGTQTGNSENTDGSTTSKVYNAIVKEGFIEPIKVEELVQTISISDEFMSNTQLASDAEVGVLTNYKPKTDGTKLVVSSEERTRRDMRFAIIGHQAQFLNHIGRKLVISQREADNMIIHFVNLFKDVWELARAEGPQTRTLKGIFEVMSGSKMSNAEWTAAEDIWYAYCAVFFPGVNDHEDNDVHSQFPENLKAFNSLKDLILILYDLKDVPSNLLMHPNSKATAAQNIYILKSDISDLIRSSDFYLVGIDVGVGRPNYLNWKETSSKHWITHEVVKLIENPLFKY